MEPVEFDEQNTHYRARPEYDELHTYNGGGMIISVWEPTIEERIAIAEGGRVELVVYKPHTPPPVSIGVYKVSGVTWSPSDTPSKFDKESG